MTHPRVVMWRVTDWVFGLPVVAIPIRAIAVLAFLLWMVGVIIFGGLRWFYDTVMDN